MFYYFNVLHLNNITWFYNVAALIRIFGKDQKSLKNSFLKIKSTRFKLYQRAITYENIIFLLYDLFRLLRYLLSD